MEEELKRLASQNAQLMRRLDLLESAIGGRGFGFGPVSDPPPDDFGGGWRWPKWPIPFPWPPRPWPWPDPPWRTGDWGLPPNADPPPDEIGRLSRIQIEARLDDIRNSMGKLERLQKLYAEQLQQLG